MAYHIGDCPDCGARLLVEYKDANSFEDIDLTESYINLTYIARCWKCKKIVKATISANINETPMEIEVVPDPQNIGEHLYKLLETRDLTKSEAMESA